MLKSWISLPFFFLDIGCEIRTQCIHFFLTEQECSFIVYQILISNLLMVFYSVPLVDLSIYHTVLVTVVLQGNLSGKVVPGSEESPTPCAKSS